MRMAKSVSVVALSATLTACAVGPDYHAPDIKAPKGFVAATQIAAPPSPSPIPAIDISRWWQSLNDPELNSLVERAIKSNADLEIALTRLQEARTIEAVVFSGALPVAQFSAGAGRGTGTNSVRGRVSPPLNAATSTTGLTEITHVIGFDAAWELDLFGKYRRQIEAARGDAEAAAEARNAVLIALVSDVARAYLDLRGLQIRLAVARQNVEAAQASLDLVQTRFNRGLTNELDVALARRQLATQQARVAPLQAGIDAARNRLAVLLNQFPEDMSKELAQPAALPTLPERLEPGIPVDLLRRRPDIRQSERELAAATARIGVATADLFPHVILTGGAGWQGQDLGRTPVVSKFIWSAGPTAYWPLLDFGALDGLIDLQDLRTYAALVQYKLTILSAVEEVDNAISNYSAQQDALQNLGAALAASQLAVRLATQRYERGLTDFLNVLDAERQEYDLEDQYAATQETASLQFVALYKGLGGGWENYQAVPPIRQPEPAIIATFHRLLAPTQQPTQ